MRVTASFWAHQSLQRGQHLGQRWPLSGGVTARGVAHLAQLRQHPTR